MFALRGWSSGGLRLFLHVASCLYVVGFLVGCHDAESEALNQLARKTQSRIFIDVMPEQVQSLKATYSTFQDEQQVTVAGRIYAESISPFDPQESSFTVIELPKPGHNHEDPGDCPFCKRELRNAKFAIVKVVDETGRTLPNSADKLLGLKKNQDVVVSGSARMVGDTLVVQASNLHLLNQDNAQTLSVAFHQQPVEVPSAEETP